MKKITDVGMYIPKGSKKFDQVPISHGGRSDTYNRLRYLQNPSRYVDNSDISTPDLYALMVKYHLKGFEFGNWVTQEERNEYAVSIKTTLEQLKQIFKTENIGFNVQIGIAFGARGKRGALAHYEPILNMINLTRQKGAGSLAHEYGHALDYNFGGFIDQNKKYTALTGGHSIARSLPDNTGLQLRALANQIVDSICNGENYGKMVSAHLGDSYWFRRSEIFARFFEQYICYLLKEKGISNRLLTKSWSFYTQGGAACNYVSVKDFMTIKPVMDNFVSIMGSYMADKRSVSLRPTAYKKPLIALSVKKLVTPQKTPGTNRAASQNKRVTSKNKK